MKCGKRLALGLDFGPDFEGYNCKLLQFALQPDGMKRMPQVFSVPVDCQCQVKLFEATLPSQGRDFKLVNHLSLNCIHIHKYRYNYLYIYMYVYIYMHVYVVNLPQFVPTLTLRSSHQLPGKRLHSFPRLA